MLSVTRIFPSCGLPRIAGTTLGQNEQLAVEAYGRLVRQFCSDHPSVSTKLWNVRSAFNPDRVSSFRAGVPTFTRIPGWGIGWPTGRTRRGSDSILKRLLTLK